MSSDSNAFHEELAVVDGLYPREIHEEHVNALREGGVDVIQKTVAASGDEFDVAIDEVLDLQETIAETDGVYQVRTIEDIQNASEDEVGVVFGFQDSSPLERRRDTRNASVFKQLGVNVIQLTYNARNFSGNGCTERVDGGISNFGLDVIEALEAEGIVLDLSHAGEQTALDALEASTQPAVFTHANANALSEHERNISDELIKATAETGGTVGLAVFPPLVAEEGPRTLDDFVAHIDYIADLVGTEHVAIGLDIPVKEYPQVLIDDPAFPNPPFDLPTGLETETDIPNLTDALLERGYTEDEVRNIMGENLLRVFEAVW